MGREYFLAETLDAADQTVALLQQRMNIPDSHIHVVSRDIVGLQQHHLHRATVIHKSDLVRGLEQGVLYGLVISLFGLCLMAFAAPWWGLSSVIGSLFLSVLLLPVAGGGLLGAVVGLRHESYKIHRFHADLESGWHLILVDSNQLEPIKQALKACPVIDKGSDNSLILPFNEPLPEPATALKAAA